MGIIFIVFAVIYLARRPKIKAMESYQYAHIPHQEFERWKRYELWSIDIFLGSCLFSAIGTTGAQVLATTLNQSPGHANSALLPLIIIGLVGGIAVFVVGLIISAVFGSMGASLKKRLGIEVPK